MHMMKSLMMVVGLCQRCENEEVTTLWFLSVREKAFLLLNFTKFER